MAVLQGKLFVLFLALMIVHEILCALVCESGTKKHGGCSANKNASIYTCTVPNVYSIVDVDVHNVVGGPQAANCTYHPGTIPPTWTEAMGGVFTFSGDTITVAGGCRAVFSVTFDACVNEHLPECEGTIKRHGCSAKYNTDTHECTIPNVFGEILNVSIFNVVSKDASCKYFAPGTLQSDWTPADGGAYSFTNTSVIMAGGCRAVVDLCLSDSPRPCEGRTMKHGGCARNFNEEYYNCTVPHVYSIIDIDVHQITTQTDNCTRMTDVPFNWNSSMGGVYGFQGNVIEVAGGCRAVFEVEFDVCVNDKPPACEGGEWKRQPCTAMYSSDYNVCPVKSIGEIMYVSIFNKVSSEECVFYPPPIHTNWNSSFGGAYTFYGNEIFVAGGCRAVFDVCGSARATCKIQAGTIVNSFDGKRIGFRGVCTYILVQHADFSVIGETGRCCKCRSCLRSITIYIEGQTITINGTLFVNGVEETLPYSSSIVDVTSDQSGQTVATVSDGITVTYDGKHDAEISVSDAYMHLLEGICGNFNLDPTDDMKIPGGEIATNKTQFANSWKTDENCTGLIVGEPKSRILQNDKKNAPDVDMAEFLYIGRLNSA